MSNRNKAGIITTMPRSTVTKSASATPYAALTPDRVLETAEQLGLQPDGSLFALNSYENRVYRVGREAESPIVLKFYRAGRWSDAQILEEHRFAAELAAAEIPVVAPLELAGRTLHAIGGFRVAVFPLAAGTSPELDQPGARELLGRTLGRLHAIGARTRFLYRPTLAGDRLGARARHVVLSSAQLPEALRARYGAISGQLLDAMATVAEPLADLPQIRLHGDSHLGNILWQATGPIFVDLDDCLQGPAIQDLWMFLNGTGEDQRSQWQELRAGYTCFADFDDAELRLIEVLRSSRMLNYSAWIAERWADPAFPRAFPWFGEPRYWERHINDLAEQVAAVGELPVLLAP